MKVVILGAGASKGSSLLNPPPIMNDFVKVGLQMKIEGQYEKLWALLGSLGYPFENILKGEPNLEELYTLLDIISSGLWYSRADQLNDDLENNFHNYLPNTIFKLFILEVLMQSSIEAIKTPCKYHQALLKSLKKGDCIISFNYDLIIDGALKSNCKWREYNGYGFFCQGDYKQGEEESFFMKSDIELLKPHGSINWTVKKERIKDNNFEHIELLDLHNEISSEYSHRKIIEVKPLKDFIKDNKIAIDLFSVKMSEKLVEIYSTITPIRKNDTYIVPPSVMKFGNGLQPEQIYITWSKIREYLLRAEKVISIGFSFNPADVYFINLMKIALKKNKQLTIELVNPDNEACSKVKKLFFNANVKKIAENIEEYCGYL